MDFNDVKQTLLEVEGVREVHNLRIWSLTVNKCALAVHLALGEKMFSLFLIAFALKSIFHGFADKRVVGQQVVHKCSSIMRRKYGFVECTIQVETYVQEMQDCAQCQDPRD